MEKAEAERRKAAEEEQKQREEERRVKEEEERKRKAWEEEEGGGREIKAKMKAAEGSYISEEEAVLMRRPQGNMTG